MRAHVTMAIYSIDSVVCGHNVWTLFLGEELQCGHAGNIYDLHTVAMNKPGTGIVGHVKREISAPCNVFLLGGGVITCIITGNHQYSLDHPQGGLDVPCQLVFKGTKNMLTKIKQLQCAYNYK